MATSYINPLLSKFGHFAHYCNLVLDDKVTSAANPKQTTHVPSVMTVCHFLSAGGPCSNIPQPKHGSNTKLLEVSLCLCAYVQRVVFAILYSQLLPLQVLQASSTRCVSLKYFIRSSTNLRQV